MGVSANCSLPMNGPIGSILLLSEPPFIATLLITVSLLEISL